MKCPFCSCEVFTKNKKVDVGKRSEQPNLCRGCRYGIDTGANHNHTKMARPKPKEVV